MLKKMGKFIFIGLLIMNTAGCVALLAGGAAGAGTAVWLSGKLTQQFNVSYEQTVKASEKALNSLHLVINKITREDMVTQLKSESRDGKEIWVDIRKISDYSAKVEVRVGGISPDKQAAAEILERIKYYI
ncbi:MAG: DUF3568 family protein [Candidatus Omnitrophota bacterium]